MNTKNQSREERRRARTQRRASAQTSDSTALCSLNLVLDLDTLRKDATETGVYISIFISDLPHLFVTSLGRLGPESRCMSVV